MLKYITALLLITLYACSEEEAPIATSEIIEFSFHPEEHDWDTLKGLYRSKTEDADMFLNLDFSSPAHVTGYSLYKGLRRNISGKVTINGDSIWITANEPGDLVYDGQFILLYDPDNVDMAGTWTMNNGKKKHNLLFKKLEFDRDFDWGDPLSKSNLSAYLSSLTSNIGEIYFEQNGTVSMEYYPLVDSGEYSQLEKYSGGWTLTKGKLFVDWKNNPIFSLKRTPVEVFMSPDGLDSIKIENLIYHPFHW